MQKYLRNFHASREVEAVVVKLNSELIVCLAFRLFSDSQALRNSRSGRVAVMRCFSTTINGSGERAHLSAHVKFVFYRKVHQTKAPRFRFGGRKTDFLSLSSPIERLHQRARSYADYLSSFELIESVFKEKQWWIMFHNDNSFFVLMQLLSFSLSSCMEMRRDSEWNGSDVTAMEFETNSDKNCNCGYQLYGMKSKRDTF